MDGIAPSDEVNATTNRSLAGGPKKALKSRYKKLKKGGKRGS